MYRGGGQAKTLGALWHGRIVDRLNVNAVCAHQPIADLFGADRTSHQHRHDMGAARHDRKSGSLEQDLQPTRTFLKLLAKLVVLPDKAHARERCTDDGRRKRCGENESWRRASHGIDESRGAGDVAAHASEGLRKRAFNNADTVGQALAFADAPAARAVETHGVNFIE